MVIIKKANRNNVTMHEIRSAHAILLLNGKYVLQLRDNKPSIFSPGQWALFGGKIDTGENPHETISREIYEELSIKPAGYRYLWCSDYFLEKIFIRNWFFVADASSVWAGHSLNEGQAVGVYRFDELADLDIPPAIRQAIERYHGQAKVNKS